MTQALEALTEDTLRSYNLSQKPVQPMEFADLYYNQLRLLGELCELSDLSESQRCSLKEARKEWQTAFDDAAVERAHIRLSGELTRIREGFAEHQPSESQGADDYAREILDVMTIYQIKRIKNPTVFHEFR